MRKPLASYSTIDVRLFAPNLGAEIDGVAIEDRLKAEQLDEIRYAFLDHQVLFFKNQKEISPRRQIELGRVFGDLHVHPIVRTHPDTQRKALYVNRTLTTRINELSEDESRVVLQTLFDYAEKIDSKIRYRWSLNDMAFWDNRCCMNRAIWDYLPAERKGRRVTIRGERPI